MRELLVRLTGDARSAVAARTAIQVAVVTVIVVLGAGVVHDGARDIHERASKGRLRAAVEDDRAIPAPRWVCGSSQAATGATVRQARA